MDGYYEAVSLCVKNDSKIREKGGIGMGKKGTPHRKWSKEEIMRKKMCGRAP